MGNVLLVNEGLRSGACLSTEEETRLVQRLRKGEREAFAEMAQIFGPRLLRLAHRLLGWSGEGQDVVQEVFARLMGRSERIGGERGLEAWLVRVTINQCRSEQRRLRSAWRRLRGREHLVECEAADVGPAEREVQQRVREAIGRLPARDREAIVLHHLEEVSVVKMAQMLGLTRNAVEVRLHRARGRLRERLEGVLE